MLIRTFTIACIALFFSGACTTSTRARTDSSVSADKTAESNSEASAVRIAKSAGQAAGYSIDEYDWHASLERDGWLIQFERKETKSDRGGDSHFGVLVCQDSSTQIFRGR